jgi:hypothetical protein
MRAEIVMLGGLELHPAVRKARRKMAEAFGKNEADAGLSRDEWLRVAAILARCGAASSILVVGEAAMANALDAARAAERLVHCGPEEHPGKRLLFGGIQQRSASLPDVPFDDGELDLVICVDALSALPDHEVEPVLREMRRVARKRFIVSERFCEPVPLAGDRRQFGQKRVEALFPTAACAVLFPGRKRATPWIVAEERMPGYEHESTELPADGAGRLTRVWNWARRR